MKTLPIWIILAALLALASGAGPAAGQGDKAAVDPALVGLWRGTVSLADLSWDVTFQVAASGAYRATSVGPGNLPDETGTFHAKDGKWDLAADAGPTPGRTDSGTYQLPDADTLVLTGAGGPVTWKRVAAAPVPPAPAPSPPPAAVAGALKTTETSLGPRDTLTPSAPVVSADDRHQIYVVRVGGQQFLALDGVAGKAGYDAIDTPRFSPDGKRTSFLAWRGRKQLAVVDGVEGDEADQVTELQFSPDGKRVAYINAWSMPGTATLTCRAVIDGVAGPNYYAVSGLTFSADGKHLAYVAGRGTPQDPASEFVVVLDGKEGKAYSTIDPGSLSLSPDGRLAYSAMVSGRAPGPGPGRVVVDGVEVGAGDQVASPPLFSPDGKHLAYAVSRAGAGGKVVVVLDGKESNPFDGTISGLTFSPDSAHLAYQVGGQPGQLMMVVDGKPGAGYDSVDDFRFGADGTHFAYVAGKGGIQYVCVTDAGEQKPYFQLLNLVLSPDGGHVAYTALSQGGWCVVRDGLEGKPYFQVLDGSLRFSPDGKRLAYRAMALGGALGGAQQVVVVDGVEGKGYGYDGTVCGLAFSPDSKRLAYVAMREDMTGVVVVDGAETAPFDQCLDAPVVFDGPSHLHVLAVRRPNLIRLDVEIGAPEAAAPADAPAGDTASELPVALAEDRPVAEPRGWLWWVVGPALVGAVGLFLVLRRVGRGRA